MIAMTGMSTTGKISTGVRTIDSKPRIRISIDITMNVYGRLSASRTIHILLLSGVSEFPFYLEDCTLSTENGVIFYHHFAPNIGLLRYPPDPFINCKTPSPTVEVLTRAKLRNLEQVQARWKALSLLSFGWLRPVYIGKLPKTAGINKYNHH